MKNSTLSKFKSTKRTPVTIVLDHACDTLGITPGRIYSDFRKGNPKYKYTPKRRYKIASSFNDAMTAQIIVNIANKLFEQNGIPAIAKVWNGYQSSGPYRRFGTTNLVVAHLYHKY